ncbi:MAG: DUF3179 domain-containing protein [Rhodothermaceae bacterium]|nr:DUF3179 domain-containing protein [Rhodothermaceae bacterium]
MKLISLPNSRFSAPFFFWLLIFTLIHGCDSQGNQAPFTPSLPIDSNGESACELDPDFLSSVLGRDVIPALSDPDLVSAESISYLKDEDLVLGIELENEVIAVPHNILWHHEIINFNSFSIPFSVTYCPLTGSGIVIDRTDLGGVEFGVSGLLYRNNLVLFDRNPEESLWPQLSRSSKCGPAFSTQLFTIPVLEMTWSAWKSLHPSTRVVSSTTGYDRDYTRNPYGNYNEPNNGALLFEMPIDNRRPPKERTLVLPQGDGGLAFPFGVIDDGSSLRAIQTQFRGQHIVVLWTKEGNSAMAYSLDQATQAPVILVENNTFVDKETGSVWQIDGRAVEGQLKGRRLKPVSNAYVAFWFAWTAFHPETDIWQNTP